MSNWRRAAYISTALLSLLLLATLCPISFSSATPAEAASGTAKASSLTFSASSSTASVSLNVTSPDGTFITSSDNEKAIFTLATDNYTGYTLSLKTTGATTLTNGSNTIAAIESDGITSSQFGTNKWGLLPSKYNCTSSNCPENATTYYQPTTTGFIMEQTSSANSTAKEYKVGLGLKADYNTPAGTYTSSAIVAEYVARENSYSISYDKGNISGTPNNMPATQSDLISTTSISLSSTTPSIDGYDFTGWCLGTVSTDIATKTDSCTGTGSKTFSAGASFGIDQTANNDITLHAMWSIKTFTITKQYRLQDTSGNYPNSYTSDGVITVNYGDSYNYSKIATTTHQATSASISNVTSAQTILLDIPRNTVTISLAKGVGIDEVAVTGSGVKTGNGTASAIVYYDSTITISATLTSGYDWVNWTGSSTYINQSQNISNITSNLSFTANGEQDNQCENHETELYCTVAAMSKGTQTLTQLRNGIATPTESVTVSRNSGVYEYSPSVFGDATDAANTSKIYYYRGILDSFGNTGTYGSDGLADVYPNYVILDADGVKTTSDTCWRIVRTTGSGGIKMIYNGNWTGSTCARTLYQSQLTKSAFGSTNTTIYHSIVSVGYTRNNNYASTSATTATPISALFGSDSSYSSNNTASDIKTHLENTWFNNISEYENKLETSAGYCNDRTLYNENAYAISNKLAESTAIVSYGTSGLTEYYFGAWARVNSASQAPSLGCPRSTVDLYTTSYANNGNKQLNKPIALLTADEAAFAGSGEGTSGTTLSNINSYLSSGATFWLFSPRLRGDSGYVYESALVGDAGYINGYSVRENSFSVRPVISLVSGTKISSGNGTATNPWEVIPPTVLTVSNSNVTSSVDTIFVPYGESATVTITPANGYYLSEVSCPTGYTCTGYNTGIGYTSAQTITITNNNTISDATIVFTAVAPGTKTYMQDFTVVNCQKNVSNNIGEDITVYDKRDEKSYTVKYINGECWMTQNLRFTETSVLSATSNVTSDKTLSYYQLDTDGDSSGEKCNSTTGYSNACIKDSGNSTKGVWYNYYAATAGTISGSSNSTTSSQDICPKNWHLPTGPNTTSGRDFNILIGNSTSGFQAATTSLTAFAAVTGGSYNSGLLGGSSYGLWWSATASSATGRYRLSYNSGNNQFSGNGGNGRDYGVFIRCIRTT